MARIFITGSTDGLGRAAARALLSRLGREAGAVEDEQRGHARAKQGLYAVEAEVDVAVFCWFGWFVGGRSWGGGERVGGGFWRGGG